MTNALITVDALHDSLNEVVLLDASMPLAGRYIPNARVFDVEAISDRESPYPHMLPSADEFAQHMSALGVGNESAVVVYDSSGISFAAARAWWMLRTFGHENVRVLQGGLPAWMAAGYDTVMTPSQPDTPSTFKAAFNPALYRDYEAVAQASETGTEQIIDVRGSARFHSLARTMDGELVPTHIPGSVNLPFAAVLEPTSGALLSTDNLKGLLQTHLPDTDLKRVVSCGSGITACVMALALYQIGESDVAVYDGSWVEWADREFIR